MSSNRKHFKSNADPEKTALHKATGSVSIRTLKRLEEIAFEKRIPLSNLLARAIHNELESPNPFNYPCELPTDFIEEHEVKDDTYKLYNYIKRYDFLTREQLVQSRMDMEIEKKSDVLRAYKYLLEIKMIEEYRPAKTSYSYPPEYRRVRPKRDMHKVEAAKHSYRKLEKVTGVLDEIE